MGIPLASKKYGWGGVVINGRRFNWGLICLISCFFSMLHAAEVRDIYKGPRPLGMGNAFVGVANDFNAVMYNPAGIIRQRKYRKKGFFNRAEFSNLYGELTKSTRELYGSINAVEKVDAAGIATALESADDKLLFARGGFFPYVSFLNAQLGFLIDSQTRADLVKRAINVNSALGGTLMTAAGGIAAGEKLTEASINTLSSAGVTEVDINKMHVDSVLNMMPMVGFALGLMHEQLSLGVNIRYIMRTEINDYIAPLQIADGTFNSKLNSYISKGTGIGVDAGMLFTVSDFWFPTFGASIRNVAGTQMTTVKAAVSAEDDESSVATRGDAQNVSVGFSIMPRVSRNIAVRLATDVHHMTSAIEFKQKLHVGAELLIGDPLVQSGFALRGGYNQALWTAGASLDVGFLVLDFASYGEELGTDLNSLEDRRYIVRLGVYL